MAFSVSAGLHETSLNEQQQKKNFQNDPMNFTVNESRMTNTCIRQKTCVFPQKKKKMKSRRCQSTEQLMEQEEHEGRV